MTRTLLFTFILLCLVPLCSAADYECPEADLSGDCVVGLDDLAILAMQWLAGPTCPSGYGDCDGNELNACEIHLLSDYNNCGACGYSCVDFPGTYCDGANCVPLICPDKWADCDGDLKNGCEINLALYSNTCTSPYFIGAVNGDVGSDQLQYTGHGSRWFFVSLEEVDLLGDIDVSVNLQFNGPDGADYKMDIYTGCGMENLMYLGVGYGDLCLCWNDWPGSNESRELFISVNIQSGTSCDDYTLTLTGNTGCDYCF